MMLGAATRNTIVCIPLAIETMTERLRVRREPCELYIPVGFATIRFGIILYFAVATLFMGTLVGRSFGPGDVVLIAALSGLRRSRHWVLPELLRLHRWQVCCVRSDCRMNSRSHSWSYSIHWRTWFA